MKCEHDKLRNNQSASNLKRYTPNMTYWEKLKIAFYKLLSGSGIFNFPWYSRNDEYRHS